MRRRRQCGAVGASPSYKSHQALWRGRAAQYIYDDCKLRLCQSPKVLMAHYVTCVPEVSTSDVVSPIRKLCVRNHFLVLCDSLCIIRFRRFVRLVTLRSSDEPSLRTITSSWVARPAISLRRWSATSTIRGRASLGTGSPPQIHF